MVTAELFKKYKSVDDFANADIKELESEIKSTGFYKNKAKNIINACRQIVEEYNGEVPNKLEELVKLAGVGRKTANVVLGTAFGVPGITCDTHVIRLSRRLGLSENSDAVKLEYDLMEVVPKKDWSRFSNALIYHGRSVCKARKPDCSNCSISKYCPSADKPDFW
jgi:endonuclease-3